MNRSQKDINLNKSIKEALKSEIAFLQKNYPSLASRNGTRYLTTTLNKLLIGHIKDCLPDLKTRVITMETEQKALRKSLGEALGSQVRSWNSKGFWRSIIFKITISMRT